MLGETTTSQTHDQQHTTLGEKLGVVALVLVLLVFIMMFVGVVGTVLVATHCP